MKKVRRLFEIPYNQLKKDKNAISFVTKYDGKWKETSTKDFIDSANNLSKTLLFLGVNKNDKIAIITERNRTEWHIVDQAVLQIGAQLVPIYASTNVAEMEYIFNHAEVKYCFVSTQTLYDKVIDIKSKVSTLQKIVTFDTIEGSPSIFDLIQRGKSLNNIEDVERIKKSISNSDLATIIYTSGTTAKPKGVMISHRNIISTIYDAYATVPKNLKMTRALSLLPISHQFERMITYMYQNNGITIYFAESMETVGADMKFVKPNALTIVPRLLEKIHDKIIEKGSELKGVSKRLFNWALEIGYKYEPDGKNGLRYESNLALARKMVFKKWKEVFGGEVEMILCGGSKLQPKLSKIFNAADLHIMDGYALTESSAVMTVNSRKEHQNKIGSVGKPVPNVTVRISEDSEILVKGDNVMEGYFKDEMKTKEAFVDGYLKTGDLGKLDKDGFLYITGRKKDLFKTSGGKYISPTKIENLLKKSDLIEQVVVIGENERFPAAIIQPNFELFLQKHPNLTYKEISNHNDVLEEINNEVALMNATLGQWERIKKIALTSDEWTTEAGHLTPTLKVKRDIVKSKYYSLYHQIYRPVNNINLEVDLSFEE